MQVSTQLNLESGIREYLFSSDIIHNERYVKVASLLVFEYLQNLRSELIKGPLWKFEVFIAVSLVDLSGYFPLYCVILTDFLCLCDENLRQNPQDVGHSMKR
jgi:hypothetical protein